ncbi:MAG: SDR family NAD(P)-dependent oxidoreductase [Bryobacteraceae bacterium]
MRLAGKVAVVTGAGSGIGEASALRLAADGAGVAVFDRDVHGAEAVAAGIRERGGQACAFVCDVASDAEVRGAMERAAAQFGRIDVLVNSAGVAVRKPVAEQDEAGWDRCMDVNVKGPYLCSKYAIPHMMEAGGSIIHLSSGVGLIGIRNRAVYSATKGALIALTRNMALDYAGYQIRVNAICPGFVRTPLLDALLRDPERTAKLTALHPLGRLGSPEDIASAVAFLASDEAAWITGHCMAVDGGFAAGHGADV